MTVKIPDIPEVDDYRIDMIRFKLDHDTYVVDSDHIAAKFIDLELALSTKAA